MAQPQVPSRRLAKCTLIVGRASDPFIFIFHKGTVALSAILTRFMFKPKSQPSHIHSVPLTCVRVQSDREPGSHILTQPQTTHARPSPGSCVLSSQAPRGCTRSRAGSRCCAARASRTTALLALRVRRQPQETTGERQGVCVGGCAARASRQSCGSCCEP